MRFFRVINASFWGDYGKILMNGMSRSIPRKNNLIQLERSGPIYSTDHPAWYR